MVALETMSLVLGAFFLVAVVAVASCLRIVDAGTSVITVRCGRPHRTLSPGVHLKLPAADVWHVVKTGMQRAEFSCDAHTADHQRVQVAGEFRFKVRSAADFLSAEATFRASLPGTCGAVVSELLTRHDLDQLMLKREQLRDELRFVIEERVHFAGIIVEDLQIVTIEPAHRIGRLRAERTLLSHERELTRERLSIEREVSAARAEMRGHEIRGLQHVADDLDDQGFRLLDHEAFAHAMRNGTSRWAPPIIDERLLRR